MGTSVVVLAAAGAMVVVGVGAPVVVVGETCAVVGPDVGAVPECPALGDPEPQPPMASAETM